MLANFILDGGGYHVVPNAEVAACCRRASGPRPLQARRRGGPRRTPIKADKNNFSPRVGFAWRLGGDNRTVLRGGFGLFHPTVASRACATCWRPTSSATRKPTRRPARPRLLAGRAVRRSRSTSSATDGVDPNIQSPDIYQYNLTLERELRATWAARELHRLHDEEAASTTVTSTRSPPSTEFSTRTIPTRSGCRSRCTAPTWTSPTTAARASSTRCSSSCRAVGRSGFAVNVAYTLAHSDSDRPRHRQQQPGRRACSTRTTSRRTAVRTRMSSSTASSRTPPGTSRSGTGASTEPTCRAGRTRSSAAGRCRRSSRREAATT